MFPRYLKSLILGNESTYLVLDKVSINQLKNTIQIQGKRESLKYAKESEKKMNFKGGEICTMIWKK